MGCDVEQMPLLAGQGVGQVRDLPAAGDVVRTMMEDAASVLAKLAGGRATVETPPRYVAERIREIRQEMALSQPVFAAALNVSAETVRAWEQGKREPDGPTLRLLEIAELHPEVLLQQIRVRRVPKGAGLLE